MARPMLAAIFISGGINALRQPGAHAEAAKPVLDYAAPAIDKAVAMSPLDKRPDNETLVKVEGGVKVAAGTLLALGKLPRTSSAVLAATLIPTTLAGHRFWEESDPEAKQAQQVHFFKNVSLLGGLLIAAADTHGKPSVAWRSRKAAEAASVALGKRAEALSDAAHSAGDSVSGLVSGIGGSGASTGSDLAGKASALSESLSATVAEKAPVVKARAAELGSAASERAAALGATASALGATASDRASGWAATASDQASVWGEDLSTRAAKAAKKAEKRGAALRKEVDKRSAEWQKELDRRGKAWEKLADQKGEAWAKAASKKRAQWEKVADKKRAEWEKSARKAAKKARTQAPGYVDQLTALAAHAGEQVSRFGSDVAHRAVEAGSTAGSAGAKAVEGIAKDARKRAKAVA
ncbi:DoxX family membrane protein [Pseudonocardia halophobica]|uniref:DoxX family membrane protein n=1 Tax=Pseudonocardia halophobica TaxID=29401 RepID=UPI003D8CD244